MLRWILLLALMLLIPLAHAAEKAKSSYRPYSDIPAEVRAKIRETPSLARIDVSTRTELKLNDIVKTDLLVINPGGILILGHLDAKYIILAAKKVVFPQRLDPLYSGLNLPMIGGFIEVAGGGSLFRTLGTPDVYGSSSLTNPRPPVNSPDFEELLKTVPNTPPSLFLCFDELQLPADSGPGPCLHIGSRGADGAPGGDVWLIGPGAVLNSPHGFKFNRQNRNINLPTRESSKRAGADDNITSSTGNVYRVKTD